MMMLTELRNVLECTVFFGEHLLAQPVEYGCASDLMSEVLAVSKPRSVLVTGLASVETLHTAAVTQITAVVLVRGKSPDARMMEAAGLHNIVLLGTRFSMYEACGMLHQKGLVSSIKPLATEGAMNV